jgi:hypothetical protein
MARRGVVHEEGDVADAVAVGPDVLRDLAVARLANDDLEGADAALTRAEHEARAIGAANLLPLVTWTRADLAGRRGDVAAQRSLLGEALSGLRERGATGHVATLSRALEALGD